MLYLIIPYFDFNNSKFSKQNLDLFISNYSNKNNLKIIISEGIYETELPDYSNKIYKHFKFKLKDPIWVKENLINVAIDKIPEAEFIAWSDRDIYFLNPFWIEQTIEKLKIHDIVQPWSQVIHTDINYEIQPIIKNDKFINFVGRSSISKFFENDSSTGNNTGQIWAINRSFFNKIKKINDIEILGGADSIICNYCIFDHSSYTARLHNKCNKYTLENWSNYRKLFENCSFGYIKGTIIHYWHGHLQNRFYNDRHEILIKNNYNPAIDIDYDENNIIYLTEAGKRLKESILQYFFHRAKDEEVLENKNRQYIWDNYIISKCLVPVTVK